MAELCRTLLFLSSKIKAVLNSFLTPLWTPFQQVFPTCQSKRPVTSNICLPTHHLSYLPSTLIKSSHATFRKRDKLLFSFSLEELGNVSPVNLGSWGFVRWAEFMSGEKNPAGWVNQGVFLWKISYGLLIGVEPTEHPASCSPRFWVGRPVVWLHWPTSPRG